MYAQPNKAKKITEPAAEIELKAMVMHQLKLNIKKKNQNFLDLERVEEMRNGVQRKERNTQTEEKTKRNWKRGIWKGILLVIMPILTIAWYRYMKH